MNNDANFLTSDRKEILSSKRRARGHCLAISLLLFSLTASAEDVVLREDWKETPAELPITQAHVVNPLLQLTLHGPGKTEIKKSHHDKPVDDPFYVWSGKCKGNWAVSLKHRKSFFNLSSENSRIRFRTKQSGRNLHVLVRLRVDHWFISDQSISTTKGWQESELQFAKLTWRKFDSKSIASGKKAPGVSLAKVDEIGFTDLESGGGSKTSSRIDWIEVTGKTVSRPVAKKAKD
jgi:hypothetical protein